MTDARAQLKELEARLNEDQSLIYSRIVHGRSGDALALVRNRTCTACSTEITSQSSNELLMGRMVICKSCGRILYIEEDAVA